MNFVDVITVRCYMRDKKIQYPGTLIVIEGIDGSGKSTVTQRLGELLQQDGCAVVVTREPSSTKCGELLRSVLRDGSCKSVPQAEFFLFAADRAMHLAETVLPALERGAVVICDRMGDSSIAYQGYGRGLCHESIAKVNEWIMQGVTPDVTFYLSIDYATAHERVMKRAQSNNNHYDHEKASFFRRVLHGYESLYAHRADVVRIDASAQLDDVVADVYNHVAAMMGRSRES